MEDHVVVPQISGFKEIVDLAVLLQYLFWCSGVTPLVNARTETICRTYY